MGTLGLDPYAPEAPVSGRTPGAQEPMTTHDPAAVSPSVLDRARAVWSRLTGTDAEFAPGRTNVAVAPASLLSPPGWAGLLVLGDAALVTVPDSPTAGLVTAALQGLGPDELAGELAEPGRLRERLPFHDLLGPAHLLFLAPALFRPAARTADVERVSGDDPELLALLDRCGPGDAAESALAGITSTAKAVRQDGEIVAAAGHELWPHGTAHLSILTDPGFRRRGLAAQVASAAVADALDQGLLAQWRARSPASRRIAHSLGFQETGLQLSLRLADR
ncbi:GNAT family N-acetyltransferase [Streptomyces sp. SID10692]|uniref:GNAT family N-acetyltransferase n=1 Tax=Streptomyces sp. SID10692 TaxID=2706026 RepID=UPI0031B9CACA